MFPVLLRMCSTAAGIEELKEGIVERRYYDESYIHAVGKVAAEKLGESLQMDIRSGGLLRGYEIWRYCRGCEIRDTLCY